MFTQELQELDLSQNEAIIYETLVDLGEMSVSDIARESGVNRRNVYDALDRLSEKGLVFEKQVHNEKHVQAVNPEKLKELLQRKEDKLSEAIPELQRLYRETPHEEEVYIYKGIEGWRNYLQDIIRTESDLYNLAGKGSWADERLRPYIENFVSEAEKKEISMKFLMDHEVKEQQREILDITDAQTRFLPEEYSTTSAVDIFGDYVVIFGGLEGAQIDENASFTVIKNPPIAESFRTWFQALWEIAKE
jgi:sugar-specific transcriptional regulator TrmB